MDGARRRACQGRAYFGGEVANVIGGRARRCRRFANILAGPRSTAATENSTAQRPPVGPARFRGRAAGLFPIGSSNYISTTRSPEMFQRQAMSVLIASGVLRARTWLDRRIFAQSVVLRLLHSHVDNVHCSRRAGLASAAKSVRTTSRRPADGRQIGKHVDLAAQIAFGQ